MSMAGLIANATLIAYFKTEDLGDLECLLHEQSVAAIGLNGAKGNLPQTESIVDVFSRSDFRGSSGPEFVMKSVKKLSNSGALCREEQKVLKASDWIVELKTWINPAKSVKSLREIHSVDEFQKFLSEQAVEVIDPNRLHEALAAFVEGKPLKSENDSWSREKADHSIVLVGSSKKEAVIVRASSNGKMQYATFMRTNPFNDVRDCRSGNCL